MVEVAYRRREVRVAAHEGPRHRGRRRRPRTAPIARQGEHREHVVVPHLQYTIRPGRIRQLLLGASRWRQVPAAYRDLPHRAEHHQGEARRARCGGLRDEGERKDHRVLARRDLAFPVPEPARPMVRNACCDAIAADAADRLEPDAVRQCILREWHADRWHSHVA